MTRMTGTDTGANHHGVDGCNRKNDARTKVQQGSHSRTPLSATTNGLHHSSLPSFVSPAARQREQDTKTPSHREGRQATFSELKRGGLSPITVSELDASSTANSVPRLQPFAASVISRGAICVDTHARTVASWMVIIFMALQGSTTLGAFPEYSHPKRLRTESRLNAIAFGSLQSGVAVGDRGVILRTTDGGDNWQPVESNTTARLEAVAWSSPRHGVIVGGRSDEVTGISRGVILVTTDGGATWKPSPAIGLPKLYELSYHAPQRRWKVRGSFAYSDLSREFESRDGGRSWQSSGSNVHSTTASANDPSSSDQGVSGRGTPNTARNAIRFAEWVQSTPTQSPIRAVCAVGKERWMAAGDHGVILRSDDQGTSWRCVRGKDRSTAVLVVTSHPTKTPWQLIGIEALEHHRRVSVLWMDTETESESENSQRRAEEVDRLHQAVNAIGGDGVDRCAAKTVPEEQEITAWLFAHAPLVLAVDGTLPPETQQRLIGRAIQMGVPRIIGFQHGRRGDTLLHINALLSNTGVLASELCSDAERQLAASRGAPRTTGKSIQDMSGQQQRPDHLAIHWLHDSLGSAGSGDSLTSGLPLRPGHRFMASLPSMTRREVQMTQARQKLDQRIQEQIANALLPSHQPGTLSLPEAIQSVLRQVSPQHHRQLLMSWWKASNDNESSVNRQQTQSDILRVLSEQHGDQSLGRLAGLLRKQREHSLEHMILRRSTRMPGSSDESSELQTAAAEPIPVSPFTVTSQADQTETRQTGAWGPAQETKPANATAITQGVFQPQTVSARGTGKFRDQQSGKLLTEFQPAEDGRVEDAEPIMDLQWDFHPINLIVQESNRRRGAENELQPTDAPSTAWQRLATCKETPWSNLLAANQRHVIRSPQADSRPHLDGNLEESIWSNVEASETSEGIQLRVTHDDEFLYIAATCDADRMTSAPLVTKQGSSKQDSRDQNLDNAHRLSFRFDVDQDLLTSFEIEVTSERQTRDRVDGNPGWQPTWYVARQSIEGKLQFEIAILRRDLVDLPLGPSADWYFSCQRMQPGQKFDALSVPVPEDWFTLRFE